MSQPTTPGVRSPLVGGLLRLLRGDPVYVDVEPQPGCRVGECFPDITRLVEEQGGELVPGWCIWERARVFAEAEHHAIWRRPDGTIIDPIPKPDGEARILFVSDPTATWAGPGESARPQVRFARRADADAVAWVNCAEKADAAMRPYRMAGGFGLPGEVMEELQRLKERQKAVEKRLQRRGL